MGITEDVGAYCIRLDSAEDTLTNLIGKLANRLIGKSTNHVPYLTYRISHKK